MFIREIRKNASISQTELGQQMDVGQCLISCMEHGQRLLTVAMLDSGAEMFGIPSVALPD